MTTLTFLGDIQRNEAAVITFAQDINAYGRVLLFKFGYIFDRYWKCEAGKVECVFIWKVVRNSIWMMWGRIYARKEGPDKALRVRGVLDVGYRCLLSQPLRSLQPGRALEWAVFRNNNYKFFNSLQCEAATAPIPMLDLTGEVGGNDVEV